MFEKHCQRRTEILTIITYVILQKGIETTFIILEILSTSGTISRHSYYRLQIIRNLHHVYSSYLKTGYTQNERYYVCVNQQIESVEIELINSRRINYPKTQSWGVSLDPKSNDQS